MADKKASRAAYYREYRLKKKQEKTATEDSSTEKVKATNAEIIRKCREKKKQQILETSRNYNKNVEMTFLWRDVTTTSGVYSAARMENKAEDKPYQHISHDIVMTTNGLAFLQDHGKVLAGCQCAFTNEKGEKYGEHYHILHHHPEKTNEQLKRLENVLLEKRTPCWENGRLVTKPIHIRRVKINCEHHLAYVIHYVGCTQASRRAGMYSNGKHAHYNLHTCTDVQTHAAGTYACDFWRGEIKRKNVATHDGTKCPCDYSDVKLMKKQEWRMLHVEEKKKRLVEHLAKQYERNPDAVVFQQFPKEKPVTKEDLEKFAEASFAREQDGDYLMHQVQTEAEQEAEEQEEQEEKDECCEH